MTEGFAIEEYVTEINNPRQMFEVNDYIFFGNHHLGKIKKKKITTLPFVQLYHENTSFIGTDFYVRAIVSVREMMYVRTAFPSE